MDGRQRANLSLCFFLLGKDEVEYHTDDGGEADAADGDGAACNFGAADAEDQDERDDDNVAGIAEVCLILHQGVDASQNGTGDGLVQGAFLTQYGEEDAEESGNTDDGTVADLGE